MVELLLLLVGFAIGFIAHVFAMKISFRQRTIDHKIRVFDALIVLWVKARKLIDSQTDAPVGQIYFSPDAYRDFAQMYAESQQLIGQAIFACEDTALTNDITLVNETLYRTGWQNMPIDKANDVLERVKFESFALAARMRKNVQESIRLDGKDLLHLIGRRGR